MYRVMALDFGSKTVGVAVNDGSTCSFPLETIRREREQALRPTLRRIEELAGERSVERFIVGLPLNMDRSEGERARKSREFAETLARRTGLPVEMQDETLSTVEAYERMKEAEMPAERREMLVDSYAAAVILEDWIASRGQEED